MKKTLFLAFLGVLLAGTAVAADLMKYPVRVATVDGRIRETDLAMGIEGKVHVAFLEDTNGGGDLVYYVNYDGTTASEKFLVCGSLQTRASQPGLGIGPKGLVGVVWGVPSEASVYLRLYDSVKNQWQPIEKVSDGTGADQPDIAIDADGNVHVFYFSDGRGACMARSKINGVWEAEYRLSAGGARGSQGGIAIGPDGWVWAMWRIKECSGNTCEYKLWYTARTKSTAWLGGRKITEGGASMAHPSITVGPDGVPWVAYGDVDESEIPEIWVCKLNEKDNPRQLAIPPGWSWHYPRIAIDTNLKVHVSTQMGAGDMGDGVYYTNNVTGSWDPGQALLGSWVKYAGIGADGWGNVAVVWSAQLENRSEVWINSLEPIQPKYFYPPVSPTIGIVLSKLKKVPQITYRLGWSANPENINDYLQGYNLYVSENGGEWQNLTQVSKTAFNAELTFTDISKKRLFGIATVSLSGRASDIVVF
jgi:hypothetical protein